jgi:hypothetical protein
VFITEQEDPDSKVSVKINLDTGHKFIVTFVDEYTGYMWVYFMKNMRYVLMNIKQWMIDTHGKEDSDLNFRHGAGETNE